MTVAQLFTKLRSFLDEAQAGFYTDSEIYAFLDTAQLVIIETLLAKQQQLRAISPDLEINALAPLTKSANYTIAPSTRYPIPLGSGGFEISDYLMINYAIVPYSFRPSPNETLIINHQKAKYYQYHDAIKKQYNIYTTPTKRDPIIYLSGTRLYIYPQPDASDVKNNDIILYYYSKPPQITSGVDPLVGEETHEAMLELAFSYGLAKDSRATESNQHLEKGMLLINNMLINNNLIGGV